MKRATCLLGIAASAWAGAFDYASTPLPSAWGTAERANTIQANTFNGWHPTSVTGGQRVSGQRRFRVAYVKRGNSQTYEFLTDLTFTRLRELRVQRRYIVEDLVVHRDAPGAPTYSAVVRRDLDNWQKYDFFVGLNAAQLTTMLGSSRRLLDLDVDATINGAQTFAGTYVQNSGNTLRPWTWLPNATSAEIANVEATQTMRVIDLAARPNGRFAAVFVRRNPGDRTNAFYLTSLANLDDILAARGMRLQTLNHDPTSGWWTGVFTNNANAQTARVADLFAQSTSGAVGAYVVERNGPVHLNLRANRPFYPASAIKTLIHAYAIQTVPQNQLGTFRIGTILLSEYCTRMMWNSDNRATFIVHSHFGNANIMSFARNTMGMGPDTYMKDHYGNPPPNGEQNAQSTLVDMGNLYLRSANLGTKFNTFAAWMLNQTNSGLFDAEIASARTATGLSTAQFDNWRTYFRYQWKGGSLPHRNNTSGQTFSEDLVACGRVVLPFRSAGPVPSIALRTYAFGWFVNDSPQKLDGTPLLRNQAASVMREQIRQSMATFR